MIKGKTVSVVVSVYNEEKTIGGVLEALLKAKKLDEIICINDGSSDQSKKEMARFKEKTKIVDFNKNRGKGAAMAEGVKMATGDIVVFFDGDLVGVKPSHVYKIVNPLVEGKSEVVMAKYDTKKVFNIYRSELSGERAYFRAQLLPHLERFKKSRYGVETYLNSVFPKWSYVYTDFYHLEKFEKTSTTEAAWQYLREGVEIVREKAVQKGLWSEELAGQLDQLYKLTEWETLEKKIKNINNKYIKGSLRKYIRNYALKINELVKKI